MACSDFQRSLVGLEKRTLWKRMQSTEATGNIDMDSMPLTALHKVRISWKLSASFRLFLQQKIKEAEVCPLWRAVRSSGQTQWCRKWDKRRSQWEEGRGDGEQPFDDDTFKRQSWGGHFALWWTLQQNTFEFFLPALCLKLINGFRGRRESQKERKQERTNARRIYCNEEEVWWTSWEWHWVIQNRWSYITDETAAFFRFKETKYRRFSTSS